MIGLGEGALFLEHYFDDRLVEIEGLGLSCYVGVVTVLACHFVHCWQVSMSGAVMAQGKNTPEIFLNQSFLS